MATRRQPVIAGWLIPGGSAAVILLLIAGLSFGALWFAAPDANWRAILTEQYLHHVIAFSFAQALLSALLSVVPAIPLARALWRRRFPGRQVLLRLCAMTLVLPVLVTVFGLLSIYGSEGWLAQICRWLGIKYRFNPYGLQGILLAHVFFNLPLATRLLLQALERIPVTQRQLAAQLGIRGWNRFILLEWPWLRRQIIPVTVLIFMLCFASFATVLALGGGPRATTIELAIYQALSYDYDPARAALLALIQLLCCLGLVLLGQHISPVLSAGTNTTGHWRDPEDSWSMKLADTVLIIAALLLLLPPLLAIIVDGINSHTLSVLLHPVLWQATMTSVRIALAAALLCLLFTLSLLWSSRELRLRRHTRAGQIMELSGMLILAMPAIVLATGLFLLLNETTGLPQSVAPIIMLINALMAIPYAMKILEHPMQDIAGRYNQLCLSLNIRGWNRFRMIELGMIKRPLAQAMAFASVLSLGDFGVVALFGNEQFRTLPFWLYQQMGSYRNQDGAVTALFLLILCFLIFTLIEKLAGNHADAQ